MTLAFKRVPERGSPPLTVGYSINSILGSGLSIVKALTMNVHEDLHSVVPGANDLDTGLCCEDFRPRRAEMLSVALGATGCELGARPQR
jgi:hypothetical protein